MCLRLFLDKCSLCSSNTRRTWIPRPNLPSNNSFESQKKPNILVKIFKCIPVIFVLFILMWAYYAYVVQFCHFTLLKPAIKNNKNNQLLFDTNTKFLKKDLSLTSHFVQALLYAIIFNMVFLIIVWSYCSVTFTGYMSKRCKILPQTSKQFIQNGTIVDPYQNDLNYLLNDSSSLYNKLDVPELYKLPPQKLHELENCKEESEIANVLNDFANQIVYNTTSSINFHKYPIRPLKLCTIEGGPRYCDICKNIKPDRCHHCSACDKCILKMDHHCPWVNNCVQYGNYKQFILFLAYGFLLCLFTAGTTLPYFISFWSNSSSFQLPNEDDAQFSNLNSSASQPVAAAFIDDIIQPNLLEPGPVPNASNPQKVSSFSSPFSSAASAYGGSTRRLNAMRRTILTTRFTVLFLFFVAVMFGISLGTLATYHLYLVGKNRTTLESFRGPVFLALNNSSQTIPTNQQPRASTAIINFESPEQLQNQNQQSQRITKQDKSGFSLGNFKANFYQVFGPKKLKWFLPVYTAPGDGLAFPTRQELYYLHNPYPVPSSSHFMNHDPNHFPNPEFGGSTLTEFASHPVKTTTFVVRSDMTQGTSSSPTKNNNSFLKNQGSNLITSYPRQDTNVPNYCTMPHVDSYH